MHDARFIFNKSSRDVFPCPFERSEQLLVDGLDVASVPSLVAWSVASWELSSVWA